MRHITDIATALSGALRDFGSSEESKGIIARALDANPWFSAAEIIMAIEAIDSQMLETEKLHKWLALYPTLPSQQPRHIGIIMAGNIPLVGFFDLLCVLAAGHQAWIKPSSKDRVLMEYVCSLLRGIEPTIPIYIYNAPDQIDAVIATGGSEANRHFEHVFHNHKRLLRSSRHSIAILSGEESAEELELLADDIYTYSGLGCRNVALIFAPTGSSITIPPRETNPKYRNNYLQTKALMSLRDTPFTDNGSSVIIHSKEFPATLSTIAVWEYENLAQVKKWIAEHDHQLQCIVSSCIEHPRRVDFGEAQRPTLLDYADGIDTMKFLDTLATTKMKDNK